MNKKDVYGESRFDYIVYTPEGYDGAKKYPLVLFLHGAGERGDDLALVKEAVLARMIGHGAEYNAIFICPQCKTDRAWNSDPKGLKEFLLEMIGKYNADEDAVSVTGLSMGGFGTWQLTMDYPELFSAAAPICGGGLAWRAGVLKDLPLRIFHGEKDDAVDVFYSKDIFRVLKNNGAKDVRLFLYPELGHNCWDEAYERTDLVEWLINQRRKK